MLRAGLDIIDIIDALGITRFTGYKVKTLVDVGMSIGPKLGRGYQQPAITKATKTW